MHPRMAENVDENVEENAETGTQRQDKRWTFKVGHLKRPTSAKRIRTFQLETFQNHRKALVAHLFSFCFF